ncbi:MAG: hypothetical protein LBD67_00800 [Candidatus Accumulibacter sp.]|nr:hypothetical protein [Accumulibacter sp.]
MLVLSEHVDDILFPFVLSLSKYERTRQGLSKASLISLLRQIQGKRVLDLSSPYPSTGSGRTDWKGTLRRNVF